MKTILLFIISSLFLGMTSMVHANASLKIRIPGKVLQMPCPYLQTSKEKKCEEKVKELRETYEKILFVDGIELVGKFIKPLPQEHVHQLFVTELNTQLSKEAIRWDSYPWGKVSSHCTASSGTTCAYLLQIANADHWVLLRYSSSVPLVFDFKAVTLK